MRHLATAIVGVLLCAPTTALAQVLERPARAQTERSASDSWRRLTVGVTTLGSWDDNLTADQAALDPSVASQSGYTGFVDSSLRFEQGKGSQSFGAQGRGYINTFRNVGLTPKYGADAQLLFGHSLGRRARFNATQDFRDEPFYTIGGFSGLRGDVVSGTLPDANPLNGVESRRSWASATRLELVSPWSSRNSLAASYGYEIRDFRDHIGDTRAHQARLAYDRNVGRRSGLRFTYDYGDSEFRETALAIPLKTHGAEAGAKLERWFSATRRLAVLFGAGATQLSTLDRASGEAYDVLAPSGFAGIRMDWARSWSASGDYRRSVAPLAGLSAQAFTTDAVMGRVGGFLSRRTELTLTAAYAEGQASRDFASFDTYSGTSQLRFVLSRDWAALVSHTFYRYALRNVDLLFAGLPTTFDRNAIRIGLALNFPLRDRRDSNRQQRTERNDAPR